MRTSQPELSGSDGISVVFLGDTSFGENYQAQAAARGGRNLLIERGYSSFLSPFGAFLKSANLVIANLETPLTSKSVSPFQGRKRFIHYGDPEAVPRTLAEHGIKAVSLANNHALDFGADALVETIDALDECGVEQFGSGRNKDAAAEPLVRTFDVSGLSFQLTVVASYWWKRKPSHRWKTYARNDRAGVAALTGPKIYRQLRDIRESRPDEYLVTFPHWGQNYRWVNLRQKWLAQTMIRGGADLVIGHGAHMLQEIARVHHAWVVYSLGNFVMNSNGRFAKFGAPPYGLIAKLLVRRVDDNLKKDLLLYPIFIDNARSDFHVRFVESEEFEEVVMVLSKRSLSYASDPLASVEKDEFGWHLKLGLH